MRRQRNILIATCALLSFSAPFFAEANEGLDRLKAGNKRFLAEKQEVCLKANKQRLATREGQAPFAIILGCADSRVPPEIIFDQNIGELFTVRVAGNVAGPLEIDSVEFAANHLGAETLLVLGHESCGAVNAVLTDQAQDIEAVAAKIAPSLDRLKAPKTLEEAIKANARAVAKGLRESEVLSKLIKEGKLEITAGYYRFSTGEVEFLQD